MAAVLTPQPMGPTRQFARFVHRSRWADLPDSVRREAVRAFVNWVGCAYGGAGHPAVDRALRAARTLSFSTACTVVGRPERLDPLGAALVNGLAVGVNAFDDAHIQTVIHPAAPTVAALLAHSEQHPVAGENFTEDVEEKIIVPVVREVPITRKVEVPTGNYCESPVGDFVNPGHFNLISGLKHRSRKSKTHGGGLLHKSKSSSSSSSSDDAKTTVGDSVGAAPVVAGDSVAASTVKHHADGSATVSPSSSKRKSFLQRIINH